MPDVGQHLTARLRAILSEGRKPTRAEWEDMAREAGIPIEPAQPSANDLAGLTPDQALKCSAEAWAELAASGVSIPAIRAAILRAADKRRT